MSDNVNNTFVETLIKSVRGTAAFKQLIPMEAITGWPIPMKKNNKIYLILPFYSAMKKEKGKTVLYPPIASITVDCKSKVIVEYTSLRFKNSLPEKNWEEEAGFFPHDEIAKLTVHDYKQYKRQLMELYDKIIECLQENKNLDEETDKQFSKLLSLLMEPGLKSYYISLAPKFFDHFIN